MSARFRFGIKGLAIVMGWTMAVGPAMTQVQAPALPTQLNLVIVRGDGGINQVRQQAGSDAMVRVEDQNHQPVSGAVVSFTLPSEGASGEFGNHSKTLTVVTGNEGEAVATGLRPNQVAGKVPVYINASYRGLMTRGSLMRVNVAGQGAKSHSGGKLALVLLLVAGAAAGGAVAATRGKQSGTAAAGSVPIGLSPGTGTISVPVH